MRIRHQYLIKIFDRYVLSSKAYGSPEEAKSDYYSFGDAEIIRPIPETRVIEDVEDRRGKR